MTPPTTTSPTRNYLPTTPSVHHQLPRVLTFPASSQLLAWWTSLGEGKEIQPGCTTKSHCPPRSLDLDSLSTTPAPLCRASDTSQVTRRGNKHTSYRQPVLRAVTFRRGSFVLHHGRTLPCTGISRAPCIRSIGRHGPGLTRSDSSFTPNIRLPERAPSLPDSNESSRSRIRDHE